MKRASQIERRNQEIILLLREGATYHDVARQFGIHWGTVKAIGLKFGVGFNSVVIKARNERIVSMLKSGISVIDISKQLKLSTTTVASACKKVTGVLPNEIQKELYANRTTCICNRCKNDKSIEQFRVRIWKGVAGRMGTCVDCEREYRLKKYWSNPEEGRRKSRESMRLLNAQKPEEMKQKRNEYRANNRDKVRKWERDWYARNESGRKKHKIRARMWHEKNRDELSDTYVRGVLASNSKLAPDEVPPELIELHRINIAIKREIRKNEKR